MSLPTDREKEKNPPKTVKYNQKYRFIENKQPCKISNVDDINSDDMMKMPKKDLMNYAKLISKRAKETYVELGSMLADVNDDIHQYRIPSTPNFSNVSSECITKHPVNITKHEDRMLVVCLASITFFVQVFSRDIWIPLFEPALIAFPLWSQTSLALFPIWNTIIGFILMIPACVIINKYGIKTSIMCSCVASTLGAFVQCLPFIGESTIVVHVSAVFLACASVFVKPLTVTISTCCFMKGERNLVTGFLTSASMAGTAAGVFTSVVLQEPLASSHAHMTAAHWKPVIIYVMYTCFAMNLLCTSFICMMFPHELKVEHTESLAIVRKFVPSVKILLKMIFNNINLLYIALAYACSNAFSWPWYQLIDVTYSTMGLLQEVGADCRLWLIVHTCVFTMSICWLADHIIGFNKWIGLVCQFFSLVFLLWVVVTLDFPRFFENSNSLFGLSITLLVTVVKFVFPLSWATQTQLVTGVMFAFPLSWATQSLLYELAADNAHPYPENMAVGLIESLKIWCENLVYLLMAVFPEFHKFSFHICTFLAGLLSFIFLAFVSRKKGTRY